MFPATMGGAAALVSVTLALVPWCLGWPMTAAVAAGLALLLRSSRGDDSARRLLWLAAPAASYVVTFLLVVGYVYDRFLLGVLVVLALWAGVALERLAAWRPAGRPVGATAAVLVVGSTWLHAVSGNAAMAGDSRYAAEEWLRVHAAGDPIVVGVGGQEYLPNLRPWRFRLTSIRASDVFDWKAELIVVNEPHARRLGTGSSEPTALDRLERGEAGYERVFRDRTILPPYALARFATWWSSPEEEQFTNLDKIGPTISSWRRVAIDHAQQPAAR
jgi:hypothetical protein